MSASGPSGPLVISTTHHSLYISEKPRFRIRPNNTTVYEEQKLMLHCVASGVPKPSIIWDKNHIQNNWDRDRVVVGSWKTRCVCVFCVQMKCHAQLSMS